MRLRLCLVILAGLLHPVCATQNCSNLIFYSQNDSLTPCFEYGTSSCQAGPDSSIIFQSLAEGDSVVKPRDFTVSLYTNGNGDKQMGVTYNWKVPSDTTSRRHIKGYYLKMQPVGSEAVHCRLFDLRNSTLPDIHDVNSYFEYSLFPWNNTRTETYIVDMFSLPLPSDQEMKAGLYGRHIITIPKKQGSGEDVPNFWITWIKTELFSAEGIVAVTFGLPHSDSKANFTKFIIKLVNKNDNVIRDYDFTKINSETYGIHNFTSVLNGEYKIKITPRDSYLNIIGKCLCWKNGPFGMTTCGTCTATVSELFNFTSFFTTAVSIGVTSAQATSTEAISMPTASMPTASMPTASMPTASMPTASMPTASMPTASMPTASMPTASMPPITDTVIAVAVVVPTVLIAVVVTASIMYWRQMFCFQSSSHDVKVPIVNRKKILLLASEDHKYFNQALKKFGQFLHLHCHCDVLFASEQLPDLPKSTNSCGWLSEKIDNADFVVIVNSEAAFHLYQEFQNGVVFKEPNFGPGGDLFMPGIQYICGKIARREDVQNVLMVRFEHTSPKLLLPIVALPSQHYCLPNFLSSFLSHIHGLDDNNELAKMFLLLQYNLEELGREWLSAVHKTAEYEKNNPGWFKQKFIETVDTFPLPALENRTVLVKQFSGDSGYSEMQHCLSSFSLKNEEPQNQPIVGFATHGFSLDNFIPPDIQSINTVSYSVSIAQERPEEIDRVTTMSEEFHLINERYEHNLQEKEELPREEISTINSQINATFSNNSLFVKSLEEPLNFIDLDCISLSSAQSV